MTAPQPTPAELEVAKALEQYLAELMTVRYQIPTVIQLANFLAAHHATSPDWDETDIANAGARGLARTLLEDNGHGEMSPGPCADALALVRRLRAQVADPAQAHAAEMAELLDTFTEIGHETEWPDGTVEATLYVDKDSVLKVRALLIALERERKAATEVCEYCGTPRNAPNYEYHQCWPRKEQS